LTACCPDITVCCERDDPLRDTTRLTGRVAIWVAAEEDAFIKSNQPQQNFGRSISLGVDGGPAQYEYTYLRFSLPSLPVGTTIMTAHFELYHGGINDDGRGTDYELLGVRQPTAPWSAITITYDNAPNRPGHDGPAVPGVGVCVNPRDWSPSGEIAGGIGSAYHQNRRAVDFYVLRDRTPPVGRGFYSNNHLSRHQDELGLAPRLLMIVQLPDGAYIDAQTWEEFGSAHDQGTLSQSVLMSKAEQAVPSWPSSWGVPSARAGCDRLM
jgi:hypothetical protein